MLNEFHHIGFVLFASGILCCSWASLFHLVPGRSSLEVFLRGSFQDRKDYTPFGWSLYRTGVWLGLVGFLFLLIGHLYFAWRATQPKPQLPN